MTRKQQQVLAALESAEWFARTAAEVAATCDLTTRGAQVVLYHLCDAKLVAADEFGYYLTREGEKARD